MKYILIPILFELNTPKFAKWLKRIWVYNYKTSPIRNLRNIKLKKYINDYRLILECDFDMEYYTNGKKEIDLEFFVETLIFNAIDYSTGEVRQRKFKISELKY